MPQPDSTGADGDLPPLEGEEADLFAAVRRAQSLFLDAARKAVFEDTPPPLTAGLRPDWNMWPTGDLWRSALDKHVRPVAARIYKAAAGDTMPDGADDTFAGRLVSRLVDWPAKVWDTVQAAVFKGRAEQDTDQQLHDRLRTAMWITRWDGDARKTAVTSTTTAQNQAVVDTARRTGRAAVKSWHSRRDTRVRAAHLDANGQTVPLDRPFLVDGEHLMFPGDPDGSPGNVLNCRCRARVAMEEQPMTDTTTLPVAAAATADTSLSWADRDTSWDGDDARNKIKEWADGNPDKLAQCFVYRDDDAHPRNIGSYKLPVATIIDGQPKLVLKAVYAAASAVQGARGGVDLPSGEQAKAKARLTTLYAQAAKTFDDPDITPPWDKPSTAAALRLAELLQDQALFASALQDAAEWQPPAAWFQPHNGDRHGIRVSQQGRVSGYLATFDGLIGANCHIGIKGSCTPPPRSGDGGLFPNFHQDNAILTLDDGSQLHPGLLTMDIGHGSADRPQAARIAHYDNPKAMAAAVIAGEDSEGIWVSGAVLPEVMADPDRLTRLRLSRFSGHWEPYGSKMQLVAATAVNVPGFQNPSATGYRLAASADEDCVPLVLEAASVDRVSQLLDLPVEHVSAITLSREHLDELAALIASAAPVIPEPDPAGPAPADEALTADCGCPPAVEQSEEDTELDEEEGALVAAVITAEDFTDPSEADIAQAADVLGVEHTDDAVLTAANWVEKSGGLPPYIKRIAKHLQEKGMDQSRAIATAINVVKKACATSDLNFPGIQTVTAATKAKMCAALAQWEALKARNAARKASAAA